MRKAIMKPCRFCGEPVFEQFWQGEVTMREMSKIKLEHGDGLHTCSLNTRFAILGAAE